MQHNDKVTTVAEIKAIIQKFTTERDWNKFHSPKNMAMNLSIEANELMEKFLWISSQDSFQEIENEAGDVLFSILAFCNITGIDATQALLNKIKEIGKKYPIEKCKGIALKYDKL